MTTPLASGAPVTLSPDYRMVTLRDVYCDAGIDAPHAISAASRDVAASTGYEVYIQCAQDRLKVRASIEAWPEEPPLATGWQPAPVLELMCPTGVLMFGTVISGADPQFELPRGAGVYHARVLYRGRQESADRNRSLRDLTRGTTTDERHALYDAYAGTEEYRIQLWWHSELPPDDDDDDDWSR